MAAAQGTSHRRIVASMLRWGLAAGVVMALLAGVAGHLTWGRSALGSVAAASALTMVFFVIGVLGINVVLGGAAGLSMAGAFVVYLGQLIMLVVVLILLSRTNWVHGRAFALAATGQALAWQVGLYVGFRRARIPVFGGVER